MAAPTIRKIRRRKLYEDVAHELEAMIRSGRYTPGSQLPSERKITEQFGVGRSAVREALFALHKMGLVQVSSGERARVIEPTAAVLVRELSGAVRAFLSRPDGVLHFQDARALFEIGITRKAALVATDQDLDRLAAALAANRAAITNLPAFKRTDVEFHTALAAVTRNPIFAALNEALSEWLAEQRSTTASAGASPEEVYQAHARIFEAVAARDPIAAQAAMAEHLDYVAAYYWKGQPTP
jgi:GntR family transcriptional repressor for pyruvate dehydrogenase complex